MRQILLMLVVAQSALSADLSITSAVYSNNSFVLAWPRQVATDPDLVRVIDVEQRQVLTQESWQRISIENLSGIFTDTTPPERSGFYRLKESEYPLALIGPDASSSSLGIRLLSPERADVLFFRPTPDNATINPNTTDSLNVVVNGGYRATVFFSPDRAGLRFRYDVAGSSLKETMTLNRGEVRLTTPEFLPAQSAAMRGADAAQSLVADLLRRYPDSATVWQDIGSGQAAGTNNEATVLYVRANAANTNIGASPAQFGGDVALMAQPMVSGSMLVPLSAIGTAMPFDSGNAHFGEMVNLNATNHTQNDPWMGFRSATNEGAPVTAAKWIYVGENGGPTNATNPPTARYAYWIEDESFKVNLNVATNGPRGTNAGTHPQDITIDGLLAASPNLSFYTDRTSALLQRRAEFGPDGFPSVTAAADALEIEDSLEKAELRFSTTVHSAGLDLSRGGFRRFNINSITNNISGPTDALNIRTSLDRVIAAITNQNSAPNFGQRFYRLGTDAAGINDVSAVTAAYANIYLQKIAAHVLDYIDDDDQPTIINNDSGFTLRTGKPQFGIEALGGALDGSNSIVAMGVENIPRLQEYAIHGRIRAMDPIGYNTSATPVPTQADYQVSIDHYFEFWNPGTRDITINNAFLKIYDQPRFGNSITGPLASEGRPTSEIPVDGVVFPAGQVTVLTTAPLAEINSELIGNNINLVVSLPALDQDRIFSGTTADVRSVSYAGLNRIFTLQMKSRTTAASDYYSAVLIGNNDGIIESFVGLPLAGSGPSSALEFAVRSSLIQASIDDINLGNRYFARGGSLRGNSSIFTSPTSTEGDPRALNEQLAFMIYSFGGEADQTRFFLSGLADGSVPAMSTVGAPNANYVNAARWVDFSSLSAGAANAPLVVGNNAMGSIGEFGHLTDPARVAGTSGSLTNVVYSRGGGRTLRIGQSELARWYDRNQTNASRTWTSWRLTDVFTTKTNLSIAGLVNPNGLLRDRGGAFRALLHGLTYLPSPEGAPSLANRVLNSLQLSSVVNSLVSHQTNAPAAGLPAGTLNPFWERGEISQLPIFNTGNLPTSMSNTFDRGREELVRRSIEMITTRGSIFTVYVLGQALEVTSVATNVVSSARMKQTFQVEPQFATADAFDDNFNPASAVRVARRFASPTNFTVNILASEVQQTPQP